MKKNEKTQGFSVDDMKNNVNTLVIIDSDKSIKEVDLNAFRKLRVSFGRNESNDIILKSQIVSGLHGSLELIDGEWYITDAGSLNGTFVNGRKLTVNENCSCRLEHSAIIRVDSDNPNRPHQNGILMLYTQINPAGKWKRIDISDSDGLLIGRDSKCGVVLDHIGVSGRHAELSRNGDEYHITDLDSTNGTSVNGREVKNPVLLKEKDVITITTTTFVYTAKMLIYKTNLAGVELKTENLSKTVKEKGGDKVILDNVSLTINPNEFVAVLGGSGAGKSTLVKAMSGSDPFVSGTVLLNKLNLADNYQSQKNIIGNVPQEDIIHNNLRLIDMLQYSAKLRMPRDTPKETVDRQIEEVISTVELREHKNMYISKMSGGQRKRASIAVELLADPKLFFLDEPTSGLDPGIELNFMKTLRNLSKEKGKTIIIITHTIQNIHLCDKLIIMGAGGKLCFYGTNEETLEFFGAEHLAEVYNKISDVKEAQKWAELYNELRLQK